MNIHAHLFKNEIIGFVGGLYFDRKGDRGQIVLIKNTYPCTSLEGMGMDRSRSVEACPESA